MSYKQVKRNVEVKFKDSTSVLRYLNDLQLYAISKGYILASVDSISYSNKTFKASFFVGQRFENVQISISPDDKRLLKKYVRVNEKLITSAPFRPSEIKRFLKTSHSALTSNGYPFARVKLDSVNFSNGNLKAHLYVNKGAQYSWKEIHIKGDSSISSVFISSLIGIKAGQIYNETMLQDISKKIAQLNFIKELKPHELLFTENGVELYLYLQSIPVSAVNGVIGLQPNPTTGRVSFTGEANLKLLNVLKHGELFELNWRSIQTQTQSFNGHVSYPFLFSTPFGVDAKFQLYKRDTTFLELRSTLGIQYFLSGGNYIKAFYQNYSSAILSGGKNNPEFTQLATIRTNSYGLTLYRKTIDYLPNPTKGFAFQLEGAIGNRKYQLNDTTEATISTTYRAIFTLETYVPLTPRNVLKVASTTEVYYAEKIFENEVFRFGGQQTLRGFNEEELFATARSILTIEYRFLLDRNSNLFAFYDQAFYENNASSYKKDHPFGFGIGLSFGTKAGIFSLSYALGKQAENPILLSNGKIHFGYIAYF